MGERQFLTEHHFNCVGIGMMPAEAVGLRRSRQADERKGLRTAPNVHMALEFAELPDLPKVAEVEHRPLLPLQQPSRWEGGHLCCRVAIQKQGRSNCRGGSSQAEAAAH